MRAPLLLITTLLSLAIAAHTFSANLPRRLAFVDTRLHSSFAADGSEYSSADNNDFEDDEEGSSGFGRGYRDDEDETPTIELSPLPLSKNAGNRFVAIVFDRELDNEGKDELDRHLDRTELTEDHVMFCRKQNLYNETFNQESMVDILWSLPM